jgi:UDP-glucose 4-epimerase
MVYASSSAVYGDAPGFAKQESMLPQPLSPYAATKLAAEYYCRVFEAAYGLTTACLRYFNVYGPGQRADSGYAAVIPSFINSVRIGEPPVIYGDGEQTRDFIYIRDVVEGTILAAESEASGIYNIAGGESVTMNELARIIMKLTGKELEPVYREPRPGDIKHSLADISRARIFGFQPRYSLEAGLREILGGTS